MNGKKDDRNSKKPPNRLTHDVDTTDTMAFLHIPETKVTRIEILCWNEHNLPHYLDIELMGVDESYDQDYDETYRPAFVFNMQINFALKRKAYFTTSETWVYPCRFVVFLVNKKNAYYIHNPRFPFPPQRRWYISREPTCPVGYSEMVKSLITVNDSLKSSLPGICILIILQYLVDGLFISRKDDPHWKCYEFLVSIGLDLNKL